MEHTIPALLIAAIMVLAGVLIADVTHNSLTTVNESWREMEAISEERLGTDLSVVSSVVGATGVDVTAVVANDGRTVLEDFAHMDMIISYNGADLQRHSTWLPYTEDAIQPDNTWTITAIAPDARNPGKLDTGELMTIRIQLGPATVASADRWFVLTSDTGVSYTVYF